MTHFDTYRVASTPSTMQATSDMLEVYQPVLDGLTECGSAICDGYAAMGKEWLSFVDRRVHADLTMPGKFASCRTPMDLVREWSTFMSTAAEDYRIEFARLAELNSVTSQRAMSFVDKNIEARPGSGQRTY
jgi:hypothetical protein